MLCPPVIRQYTASTRNLWVNPRIVINSPTYNNPNLTSSMLCLLLALTAGERGSGLCCPHYGLQPCFHRSCRHRLRYIHTSLICYNHPYLLSYFRSTTKDWSMIIAKMYMYNDRSIFICSLFLPLTLLTAMFSACTLIWDVSNDTIAEGDYTGVLNLAILTMALSVVPLSMVWVLPDRLDIFL